MQVRLLLIISLFLLAGWHYLANLSFSDTRSNFVGNKKRIELAHGKTLTETVTATEGSLAQINIAMGTEELWVGETITLTLMDLACEETLRTRSLHIIAPHRQGAFVTFSFAPLQTYREQRFCIKLHYASPFGRKDRPTVLAVRETATDSTRLQMRLAYRPASLSERAATLETRLSQYKPKLVKGNVLLLGIIAVLLGVAVLNQLWKQEGR